MEGYCADGRVEDVPNDRELPEQYTSCGRSATEGNMSDEIKDSKVKACDKTFTCAQHKEASIVTRQGIFTTVVRVTEATNITSLNTATLNPAFAAQPIAAASVATCKHCETESVRS